MPSTRERARHPRGRLSVRVLVAEKLAAEGIELLRAQHDVDVRVGLSREELLAALPDYDALLVRSEVKVDAEAIAAGRRLLVIGRAGVGVDNIDLAAATAAGIIVVNAPTGNTIAAAEHTLALLFALARHVPAADASMHAGEWKRADFMGRELVGKVLGVIGLGKIGMAVADRARALGMQVVGFDPFVTNGRRCAARHPPAAAGGDPAASRTPSPSTCPMTKDTRGLIGAAELARMKRDAYVINVARGGVIDEAALAEALRAGHDRRSGRRRLLGGAAATGPSAARRPERHPHAAPRCLHRGGPDTRRGRGLRAGRRRPRRPARPLRGQRPAHDARDGRCAGALPAAGPHARPVLRAVRRHRRGPHARGRGRARSARLGAPRRGRAGRHPRDAHRGARQRRQRPVAGQGARHQLAVHEAPRRGSLRVAADAAGERSVAGTVSAGEPRLVALDGYEMDLAPTPYMLVSRHEDRPGAIGAVGQALGEADVNISAMHLGRSDPRSIAFMILALDEPVPEAAAERIRSFEAMLDVWLISLELAGVTRPVLLALVRHGESEWIAQRPLPGSRGHAAHGRGHAAGQGRGVRLATPASPPTIPVPDISPLAIWHSPLRRAGRPRRPSTRSGRPTPLFARLDSLTELSQGEWEGLTHAEVRERYPVQLAAWRADPLHHHAPGGEPLGAAMSRAREALDVHPRAGPPRTTHPTAGPTRRRSRSSATSASSADRDARPGPSSSATTACCGCCSCGLLGVPIEHFWSFPFALAARSASSTSAAHRRACVPTTSTSTSRARPATLRRYC